MYLLLLFNKPVQVVRLCWLKNKKLIPSEHTLKLFARLKSKIHVGTLAVKLSRESSFEVKVMKLCTVAGWRDLPALPVVELGQLKELLFKQFPDYMPTEFEPPWSRCIESINQGARDFVKERSRVPDYYYLFNIWYIITIIMMIKKFLWPIEHT